MWNQIMRIKGGRLPAPSATDPRVLNNSMPASTYFIESGNFFRLNNVTLGYTLPKQLLERMKNEQAEDLHYFPEPFHRKTLQRFLA